MTFGFGNNLALLFLEINIESEVEPCGNLWIMIFIFHHFLG